MYDDTDAGSALESGRLQRGLQQAGDNLHATIERVAQPVQQAVNRASASAHETVDRMADGVAGAAQRLDARLDRVRATPNHALECARDYVAARPFKALATALAVGWLLGRLGAHR